ncbi:TPR repeat-containing thioredoxin TTL1-like [Cornus florida]|uniref:TPR repeat-containing thioredoxin TTL1-like n=1 Tax=Cornus florida TaxID=4283 RepID=UPI00289AADE6|nr:TPR repeat-containing thioredoxin TTL1-like [Cornus florida]
MGDITSPEKKTGCGLLDAFFGRKPRRTTSTNSIPTVTTNGSKDVMTRIPSTPNSKRRRGGSDEAAFLDLNGASSEQSQKPVENPNGSRPSGRSNTKAAAAPPPPVHHQHQHHPPPPPPVHHQNRKAPEEAIMVRSVPPKNNNHGGYGQGKKLPFGATGISGELESMIADHQRSKGPGGLVRASSSNVMLMGNLGNLRHPDGNGSGNANLNNVVDYQPKAAPKEESSGPNGKYPTSVMGNVVKKTPEVSSKAAPPASLCRALSTRMDPETLKIMGNEDYKSGRFEEALALYDAAISIDPNKASYRSNKSAALTALGRLLEAVLECREAIRIEPYYQRAHNRLATLYLRLGETEKAIYHYKHAGAEADPEVISKAKKVQFHLSKCTEAKKLRDWNALLKEASNAISAGADSAPLIYALQAEALLRLHRHQDADETLTKGPNFDPEDCTKFFGPIGSASLLVIRAQVDMAAGRFDIAVAAAQRATRLDGNNKEANMVFRRTRAVAGARSKGNDLFKASKYSEACGAYGEGLDHDSYNSVLLCNRAACLSKLGEIHKAIEDCNAALNVRPSYSKARLRRADCNAKLEKWEACIRDYEVLRRETPDDEEVGRALKEAQTQLNRQRGGGGDDVKDMKVGGAAHEVVLISSEESFMDYLNSPGISVVLFSSKPHDKQTLHFMEQLCKRYHSINFLKVEVEDHPSLAEAEEVSSFPAFNIYKNGSREKEIAGDKHDLLERSIKSYAT